jgi:hypothetical protein
MKPLIALAALALSGCATLAPGPQDQFFSRLSALCGKAFEGRIASPPVEADAAFAGKRLVMHVRECSGDTIRIPFHVGEDRSRTWVITRIPTGLRLKHDHRHEDGSEDKLTQYGGDTLDEGVFREGSPQRQEFPADQFTKDLFVREKIPQSVTNVWAMEVVPAQLFAYELRRPNRFFRVDFDLTKPVAPPPPPWGAR